MKLALKTASYGLTHIAVATAVAYTLTGNLTAAIGIGLIEPIIQTGVFSVHEYLWESRKPRSAQVTETVSFSETSLSLTAS